VSAAGNYVNVDNFDGGQQMYAHRDDFIADLADVTKSQIRALEHDTRMTDLLKASITGKRCRGHSLPGSGLRRPGLSGNGESSGLER
jgi:hypothetical protein